MTERENELRTQERALGERGYGIQYVRSSTGDWKCSICHDLWWTDNPYASIALPTGGGDCQIAALEAAIKELEWMPLRKPWVHTADVRDCDG